MAAIITANTIVPTAAMMAKSLALNVVISITASSFFTALVTSPRAEAVSLSEVESLTHLFVGCSLVGLLYAATARDQVEYQDDYGDHYQDVNKIPTEVTDESQ